MRAVLPGLLILLFLHVVGCGNPTAAACQAYLEHYAELGCTAGVEVGIDCRQYEDYPCDASAYFVCADERQTCEDGVHRDGFAECTLLAACP